MEVVGHLNDLERDEENTQARIHAIGWSGLFNGFSDKGPKTQWSDLLPFPEHAQEKAPTGLSFRARRVIKRLISQGAVDSGVAADFLTMSEIANMFD